MASANLWEVLLCQKVPCVLCVLWEYSLPRISQINTDGWLRKSSHGIHRIHRSLGGCWLRGYGRMPYPPNLCASVPICGRYFSARRFCAFRAFCESHFSARMFRVFRVFCGRCFSARRFRVFRAFCGRFFSTRRVRSVGDYSFSMRKRLTMPKTRA